MTSPLLFSSALHITRIQAWSIIPWTTIFSMMNLTILIFFLGQWEVGHASIVHASHLPRSGWIAGLEGAIAKYSFQCLLFCISCILLVSSQTRRTTKTRHRTLKNLQDGRAADQRKSPHSHHRRRYALPLHVSIPQSCTQNK